jgi:HK97 family phage major capsid protein
LSEAINQIIEEIKQMKSENKTEFNAKFQELQDKLKTRNDEYDAKFKTLDEQRENFIEEKIQPEINKAIEEFKKAYKNTNKIDAPNHDIKVYGANFGNFMYKVRKNSMDLKGLSENTGTDGGYLVPDVWSQEIGKMVLESSIFRNNGAKTINMPSLTFKIPNLKYNSNADGSQYGGVTAYWSDEATDMAGKTSAPKFEYTELDANKLIGFTEAPEELIEDAFVAIAPFLQSCFAEVISFKEDAAFFNGDGVGKPLGVRKADCRVTVSRATASQVHPIDLVGMIARFKGSLDRAVWIVNQSVLPQLYLLQDNNGNFIFVNNYNSNIAGSRMVGSLFGIPVKVTEKAEALGTEGDIGLYDLGQYIIGDRSGMRIEESMHYYFNTDKNSWRFIKRVDGKPWMNTTITPYKGGSTLSPFVLLY